MQVSIKDEGLENEEWASTDWICSCHGLPQDWCPTWETIKARAPYLHPVQCLCGYTSKFGVSRELAEHGARFVLLQLRKEHDCEALNQAVAEADPDAR